MDCVSIIFLACIISLASTELARTRQLLSEEKITSENKSKENEALFQHIEKLQSHITSDEVKIAHLEAYVKECELNVHDSKDRLERTRASLDRTKTELEEWKKFGNKQSEKLQSITNEFCEISTLFNDITESIEALKLDIKNIDSRLIKAILED